MKLTIGMPDGTRRTAQIGGGTAIAGLAMVGVSFLLPNKLAATILRGVGTVATMAGAQMIMNALDDINAVQRLDAEIATAHADFKKKFEALEALNLPDQKAEEVFKLFLAKDAENLHQLLAKKAAITPQEVSE